MPEGRVSRAAVMTARIMTIVVFILVFYLVDSFLIRTYDQNRIKEGSGRSWDYTLMIFIGLALVFVQPVLLPALNLPLENTTAFLLGMTLLLSGFGLHLWSRRELRHFYTERVELQPDHKVVDSGPYQYIRHPIFTSFFLMVIAIFLILPTLFTLLLVIYTLYDFTGAAKQEENLLSDNLPAYKDYMRRTGRFFPLRSPTRRRLP